MVTKKEARYISDKQSLDSNLKALPKDHEGFYHEKAPYNLGVLNVLPENYEKWAKEKNKELVEIENKSLTEEEIKEIVRSVYPKVKEMLIKYIDMPEDYYKIVSIWTIGTYFHSGFYSYPYLFFNAMRGSGKTRLLKLVKSMACDGQLLASLTEAVMFRSKGTLAIDEFEGLGRAESAALRELLNASYKKGTTIQRTKKRKGIDGEEYVLESFEPFRPIVMANINGMEEVLGDRCITLILEKSNHPAKTKLIELFEQEENINYTLTNLEIVRTSYEENSKNRVELCRMYSCFKLYDFWNKYIEFKEKNTTQLDIHTYNTLLYTTIHTQYNTFTKELFDMFELIYNSGIYGRNLELWMPLFLIAELIGMDELKDMIRIAEAMTQSKKEDEAMESRDVMVIDFVSNRNEELIYYPAKQLFDEFRIFIGATTDDDWVTTQWFGLALKRLKLVTAKRRKGQGMEIMLNVAKAKKKIIMFR